MISYDEAKSIIKNIPTRISETEIIDLSVAQGRLLGEDIIAIENLPSFTNSAMDGFSLFSGNTVASKGEKIKMKVMGLIGAGDLGALEKANYISVDHAIEIMTGAALPNNGHDSVVKIEDVEECWELASDGKTQEKFIILKRPIIPRENIRSLGSDVRIGDQLLSEGSVILPEMVMMLAAQGISKIKVKRKIRIGIVCTGDELQDAKGELVLGMIRNSNGPFLCANLQQDFIALKYYGIIKDQEKELYRVLDQAVDDQLDILISSGAVSKGVYDFVTEVVTKSASKIFFHKVAIRPGKPILFAKLLKNDIYYFGLPGNPISAALGLRFFVFDLVKQLYGLEGSVLCQAKLLNKFKKPTGLRGFMKGQYKVSAGVIEVVILEGQSSYMIDSLVKANCWVELGDEQSEFVPGNLVVIHSLSVSLSTKDQL